MCRRLSQTRTNSQDDTGSAGTTSLKVDKVIGLLIVMGVVLLVALLIALLELAIAGQLEALRSGVRYRVDSGQRQHNSMRY